MTDEHAGVDFRKWHDEYDVPGSRLYLRLLVVQDLIARALDELPSGPIRTVSMCAGQGRDILTVARRHRRGADVHGRLVELDPVNAARAQTDMEAFGLSEIEVCVGDAGITDVYAGAVPADLVLACGVFGNVPDEDIEHTIELMPTLCAPGAWMLWTRYPRGDGFANIPAWLDAAGFQIEEHVVCEGFSVGAARLRGPTKPFEPGRRLFSFSG